MVLLDHFRPPLSSRRHWHAFHNAWATYLATDLNQKLPEGFFAEPNVQFGIEIDVAAFEESAILPIMPLWLDADRCVPLMLQETYEQTCRSQRITAN
jgi:hypothetical protein